MRRGLQLARLSGIVTVGLVSAHAFGQENPDAEPPADVQPPVEEAKTEAVAPVAPVPAIAAPAVDVIGPAAKPSVGSISTHGYFRGGWGGNANQKGRMTCFGLSTIT